MKGIYLGEKKWEVKLRFLDLLREIHSLLLRWVGVVVYNMNITSIHITHVISFDVCI